MLALLLHVRERKAIAGLANQQLPLQTGNFMEVQRRSRLKVWTPLAAAVIMVLGMTLGFRLHDTLRSKRDINNAVERNDHLEQIIDLIQQNYVDSVNSNAIYGDAVKGILSHLDPHTVYIPAEDLAGVNEDLEGSFFGIGIEYAIIRDTIEVTYVVPEGPSEKAGLQIGDRLIRVNDTLVAGNGINSGKITRMLRGEQRTDVHVLVRSLAELNQRTVSIVRDEVPLVSVDAAFLLDPKTGYIKVNRFSATTYTEFAKELKDLKRKGAANLILDLRQNPGGYLDAARNIADEFLDDQKLIVYTKSLHEKPEEYKAENPGMFEQGRLILLLDEGSASATEILAGAIQDWDRGIIIGRRSFGKGLVQQQYDLENGAALRLTIARYYTPSGRSIQRSFKSGKQAYEEAFEQRFKTGELTGKDSIVKEDTQTYYTLRNHRIVHGGGGIKPDVYVPYDSSHLSPALLNMMVSDGIQEAEWDYYATNLKTLKSFQNIGDFIRGFNEAEQVLNAYLKSLSPSEKMLAGSVLQRKASKDYFILQIRSQIGRMLFSNNGYYSVAAQGDDVIQKALQLIHSPQYDQLLRH